MTSDDARKLRAESISLCQLAAESGMYEWRDAYRHRIDCLDRQIIEISRREQYRQPFGGKAVGTSQS